MPAIRCGCPTPLNPDGYCPQCDTREWWDTTQLQVDYEVLGFSAPYVVVIRKADKQKGSLEFTHMPRRYYNFQPYEGD
jgi:hypothetical protein